MPNRRWLVLSVLTLALILAPFFLFGERIERATTRFVQSAPAWWTTATEASVLFAGFTRMPRARFLWITALSNLGISLAYVGAAAYSARQESFLLAFGGVIVVPAVGMALMWRRL